MGKEGGVFFPLFLWFVVDFDWDLKKGNNCAEDGDEMNIANVCRKGKDGY